MESGLKDTLFEIAETHIAGLPAQFSKMDLNTKLTALKVIMLMKISNKLDQINETINKSITDLGFSIG